MDGKSACNVDFGAKGSRLGEGAPVVSVIVPVYKVESYLRRCLDSIIGQTYTNLEIILVDDGSPDGCPAICDEYAERDKRVVVIHKENGGLSDARNAGLDIAKGEYVAFVDGDDWIERDYVGYLVRCAAESGGEIVISDYLKTDEPEPQVHLMLTEGLLHGNREIVAAFCKGRYPPNACAKLYKRSLLASVRFCKGLLFEDQLWACATATIASSVYATHMRGYRYVVRAGSIMTDIESRREQCLASWAKILSTQRELLAPYLPELADDVDFLIASKVNETFFVSLSRGIAFREIFRVVRDAIGQNPVSLWSRKFKGKRRAMFSLLAMFPPAIGGGMLGVLLNASGWLRRKIFLYDYKFHRECG